MLPSQPHQRGGTVTEVKSAPKMRISAGCFRSVSIIAHRALTSSCARLAVVKACSALRMGACTLARLLVYKVTLGRLFLLREQSGSDSTLSHSCTRCVVLIQ